jgi:hypothetical protein
MEYGKVFRCSPLFHHSGFLYLVGARGLSLVDRSFGVRGVGSSNLPVPTILFLLGFRSNRRYIRLDLAGNSFTERNFVNPNLYWPGKVVRPQLLCNLNPAGQSPRLLALLMWPARPISANVLPHSSAQDLANSGVA